MTDRIINISDKYDNLTSVYPCTEYLTFGPWIYLVPQYPPENVLILGYAGGTAAGLIKLFYGDIPITGVDIDIDQAPNYYDVKLVEADAKEYVKDCPKFDCIIVDVFNDKKPPKFIESQEFADNVSSKCNYLIVHARNYSNMKAYKDLHKVKTLSLSKARFHYYMVNRIARLPIR